MTNPEPDVNHFLPASLAPQCRHCRVLTTCGGDLADCPYKDLTPQDDA